MSTNSNAVKSLDKTTRKNTEKKQAKVKSISLNKFALIKTYLDAEYPSLRRNLITAQLEVDGLALTESKLISMYVAMTSEGGDYEKIKHADWILFLASDHVPSFNPLSDYFTGLDIETRVTGNIKALATCLELDGLQGMTIEHLELFLKRWLVGMVASIFDNNHNPLFIVLIGAKGCGKTYFARHLLPKELQAYAGNIHITDSIKDNADAICSVLLAIVDEMDYLTKREANGIRSLLSTDYFMYRPPYAKMNIKRKRLASFFGTSNEFEIISDRRNNRRIIPICLNGIDWNAYNAIDKTELMREAFQLFYNGEDWNLTQREINLLDSLTGGNAVQDIEQEMIIDSFITCEDGAMTASQIAKLLQNETPLRINHFKVGKALSEAGFKRAIKKINGKTQRCWQVRYKKEPFM